MKQNIFWKNNDGKKYINRNLDFNSENAIKAWNKMLHKVDKITSILECGSNIGRNLIYLDSIFPKATKSLIEINNDAYKIAIKNVNPLHSFNGTILESTLDSNYFDLVFTCGVLIHIHPDQLLENCNRMFEYSSKYILLAEYFSREPEAKEYHGEKDLLFKRDFGKYFIENFPVKIVNYGFLWGYEFDTAGYDDITYWLFKK